MIDIRALRLDHPDAERLIKELQHVYVERYGDGDATPIDPHEFDPPGGAFFVGYHDGVAVACGGWRAREQTPDDPELRDGDAELKRMYVAATYRGKGFARALLAAVEHSAGAAGQRRIVLETGTLQPEAIGLYTSSGYGEIPNFGVYRGHPLSRCFAKDLPARRSSP